MKLTPLALVALLVLTACGDAGAEERVTGVIAADPWVRTTDGAQMPEMTALYVNLTNPGPEDVSIIGADCGDVAEAAEIHEMVMLDGDMVMRKAENGLVVPRESHLHMAPGGPHVMLMGLTRQLPAGSEEIACVLEFDNDQTIEVVAPVKQFTEEQDTYHTHAPSDG